MKRIIFLTLIFGVFSITLFGNSPEGKKLNREKLQILHEHLISNIKNGKVPGAVVLVSQNNRIIFQEAEGFSDIELGKKMTTDQVFRLASMSKPITGTAILMLIDEGKISLNDPLSKFIPQFKDLKVGVSKDQTVPANREVTIKDLLTHSSGIGQGGFSTDYINKIPHPAGGTLAEYIPELAKAPLDFQPGTKTGYSAIAGFDILGRVVEIVSGEKLDQFLCNHLFKPLQMNNTGFLNSPRNFRKSLPNMYQRTDKEMIRDIKTDNVFLDSTYFSGAAGMVGTIGDYYHFAQMLANKGTYKGKRILSPEIIEAMASPQLPDSIVFYSGQTWGLSVRVITKTSSASPLVKGSFGWSGAWGTHFWVDPVNKIIALYMTNVSNGGGAGAETARELEKDVMESD